MKFTCPCCDNKSLDSEPPGSFEICPVCHWEDDDVQFHSPDYAGGANHVSLHEARENYRKFGVCEQRFIKYAQSPRENDKRDTTGTHEN
jgi:hypothetical protein